MGEVVRMSDQIKASQCALCLAIADVVDDFIEDQEITLIEVLGALEAVKQDFYRQVMEDDDGSE